MDYDLWLLQNDDTESYYVADMTILVTYWEYIQLLAKSLNTISHFFRFTT